MSVDQNNAALVFTVYKTVIQHVELLHILFMVTYTSPNKILLAACAVGNIKISILKQLAAYSVLL